MCHFWRKLRPSFSFLTFRHPSQHEPYVRRHGLTKRFLFPALLGLGAGLGGLLPASAQTTIFNCPSFSSTGDCAAVKTGYGDQTFLIRNGGSLSGDQIDLVPADSGHNGYSMAYYTPVNIGAFSTTFTFIPNGQNIAFVVQNSTTNPGYTGNKFSSGAGCEAGFYQAFGIAPNNLFALEFDSGSWLTEASEAFTYSSVQTYHANQSPCLPNDSGPNYVPINKISTYPVALNSPANAQYTTTGHVYSATVSYNGTRLSLSMYDQTAGGSCPGSNCFTNSWIVDIASMVGGPTAYIGFTAGINIPGLPTLHLRSWNYSDGSGTAPITAQAGAPTFSPGGGQYADTQSVQISDSTPNASVYYTTDGTTPTTSSPRYSAAISVGASETVRAMAVAKGDTNSLVASANYTITPTNPGSGNGAVIDYSAGFGSHPSGLWLGNSAAYSGSSLELTPSRADIADNVWAKTSVNVQNFSTTFTWKAVCPAKPALCGDGMGFMIIGRTNPSSGGYNYSGFDGSQLAWSRCVAYICPPIKSVLVKFDMFDNSKQADGANLTGFYSAGVAPQLPFAEYDMSPSGIHIESGHLMKATLTYNGAVLMETVTDTVTGATYATSYSENIPELVGGDIAYVGFGGSSGEATVTQDIQSWTYTVK